MARPSAQRSSTYSEAKKSAMGYRATSSKPAARTTSALRTLRHPLLSEMARPEPTAWQRHSHYAAVLNVFGSETIGTVGSGTFIQTGGTNNLGSATDSSSMTVGYSSAGIYSLGNGTATSTAVLNVFGAEVVGYGRSGQLHSNRRDKQRQWNSLYWRLRQFGNYISAAAFLRAERCCLVPAELCRYMGGIVSANFFQQGGTVSGGYKVKAHSLIPAGCSLANF